MLEFAVSFTGLIMFIYVVLNVWVWLNSIMVERQRAFQHTRVAAGQPGSAGAPVGYARPPLRLVGVPESAGGDPPPLPLPGLTPPCTAADPYYAQAEALFTQAEAMAKEAQQSLARLSEEWRRNEARIAQIEQVEIPQVERAIAAVEEQLRGKGCSADTESAPPVWSCPCPNAEYYCPPAEEEEMKRLLEERAGLLRKLEDLRAELAGLRARQDALRWEMLAAYQAAQPKLQQAQAMIEQGQALVEQGRAACP